MGTTEGGAALTGGAATGFMAVVILGGEDRREEGEEGEEGGEEGEEGGRRGGRRKRERMIAILHWTV